MRASVDINNTSTVSVVLEEDEFIELVVQYHRMKRWGKVTKPSLIGPQVSQLKGDLFVSVTIELDVNKETT